MTDLVASERAISFGPFRLVPTQRLLLEDDNPVRLGSRALDILTALVERPGELVGKHELMDSVWRDTVVEEGNLKFQVGALRRALGDGRGGRRYIATSAGQGYRFVAPVSVAQAPAAAPLPAAPTRQNHNLPQQLTRLIGRADAVSRIVARLQRHRLLSIVGPGGIGKTSVALAAAEALIDSFVDGVWFIDLAPLADARLVPSAVAQVLGFNIRSDDPVPGLVGALRDRRLVLVLDNSEHVIEAAATLAAAILRGTAGAHILATSREPLRVEGEHVQHLPPLSSGAPSGHLGAAEALVFPAVELFVERTAERLSEYEFTDEDAPIIAEICRKLDGIPLAIELAGARVETFGVRGLAARLDDRFRFLTSGRRSGPPRHRTLRAALDWSYEVLPEAERAVLRRLGIFMGGFTLDAACAVAADPGLLKGDVIDAVAELAEKSLAAVETTETEPRLRLLETTRAYALERLAESGEWEAVARRHAEFYRDLFEKAETESEARPAAEWLVDYAQEIDNLRASLDWAVSAIGDAPLGLALTVAAIPLWLQLSMVDECRSRVEQALALLAPEASIDARDEMKLQAALSASLLYTRGATPEAEQASATALCLAESLGDTEYQLRALWELWVHRNNTGEYAAALAVAQKFYTLALKHAAPATLPIADRMIGTSYHYLGDQTNAWRYIERMLSAEVDPQRRSPLIRFWFDEKVAGRVVLARILWLRGLADQAWRTVQSAVGDAEALGDRSTLCYALSHGSCLIALWLGSLAAAESHAEMLLDHSRKHGFGPWGDFASRIKGVVLVKTGDLKTGSTLLRAGLDEINDPDFGLWFLTGLTELAEALGHAGRIAEGLATIKRGIDQSKMSWLAPELLRIKGELLLLQGTAGTTEAVEDVFRQALHGARQQATLSWELRAATSLARLLRNRGRPSDAMAVLQPVYDRFTEGFDTTDLHAARRLLDELNSPHRQ